MGMKASWGTLSHSLFPSPTHLTGLWGKEGGGGSDGHFRCLKEGGRSKRKEGRQKEKEGRTGGSKERKEGRKKEGRERKKGRKEKERKEKKKKKNDRKRKGRKEGKTMAPTSKLLHQSSRKEERQEKPIILGRFTHLFQSNDPILSQHVRVNGKGLASISSIQDADHVHAVSPLRTQEVLFPPRKTGRNLERNGVERQASFYSLWNLASSRCIGLQPEELRKVRFELFPPLSRYAALGLTRGVKLKARGLDSAHNVDKSGPWGRPGLPSGKRKDQANASVESAWFTQCEEETCQQFGEWHQAGPAHPVSHACPPPVVNHSPDAALNKIEFDTPILDPSGHCLLGIIIPDVGLLPLIVSSYLSGQSISHVMKMNLSEQPRDVNIYKRQCSNPERHTSEGQQAHGHRVPDKRMKKPGDVSQQGRTCSLPCSAHLLSYALQESSVLVHQEIPRRSFHSALIKIPPTPEWTGVELPYYLPLNSCSQALHTLTPALPAHFFGSRKVWIDPELHYQLQRPSGKPYWLWKKKLLKASDSEKEARAVVVLNR
ncbi:Pxr1, partial [Ophiophagus hannah]